MRISCHKKVLLDVCEYMPATKYACAGNFMLSANIIKLIVQSRRVTVYIYLTPSERKRDKE